MAGADADALKAQLDQLVQQAGHTPVADRGQPGE